MDNKPGILRTSKNGCVMLVKGRDGKYAVSNNVHRTVVEEDTYLNALLVYIAEVLDTE